MNSLNRVLTFLFLVFGIEIIHGKQAPDPLAGPPLPLKSPQEAVEILQKSTDRLELAKAAAWLCNHGSLDQLLPFLLDPKIFNRLNQYSREGIAGGPNLVGRVYEEIGKLATPEAEEALLRLINDKEILNNHFDGVQGLIRACGWLGPSSDKVIPFLAFHINEGGLTGITIESLAQIASPQSCAVLKEHILSPAHEIGDKSDWFHSGLLAVRNKPCIVALFKDVLNSKNSDKALRNISVETLFDYRAYDWYAVDSPPRPPKWSETPPEVLRQVLEVADMALKMDITSETREGVLKAQKEIQQILLEKQKK